ncbi:MAG: hypothetical protein IJJ26_13640 [Victivallales bacterium]|nr:hypothetical protein [Victivallales bacterium]
MNEPPFTEWEFGEDSDCFYIFDSNFYGVNSGARIAIVPVRQLVARLPIDLAGKFELSERLRCLATFLQTAPKMYKRSRSWRTSIC